MFRSPLRENGHSKYIRGMPNCQLSPNYQNLDYTLIRLDIDAV